MLQRETIQERVSFGPGRQLCGILAYPAVEEAARAMLICSPHPNFGGDMENNVVSALAEKLATDAVVLRFDYRGVGQSGIELPAGLSVFDYWEQLEATLDYRDPLCDVAAAVDMLASAAVDLPLVAVGYSFGAVMATRVGTTDPRIAAMAGIAPPLKRVKFEHLAACSKPCLLISGKDDFVYDAAVADRLVAAGGPKVQYEKPAGDHFFIGDEARVADRIWQFFDQSVPRRPKER